MALPEGLAAGIEELTRGVDGDTLARSARALSDAYRAGGATASRAARTEGDVSAYLATRAPATYAAAVEAFRQIDRARPGWQPRSILDLGAGPGLAAWAACGTWASLADVRLVEQEPAMLAAGRRLAAFGDEALRSATWVAGDATGAADRADLVVMSYLVGELEPNRQEALVRHAWSRATDVLAIVEPGTTRGYERVLAARSLVIAAGGSVLAPCPHDAPCPLPAGDWCHFATRLPRTRSHRRAKGAERGFEDEKFSYVALGGSPAPSRESRVLRRPDLRPGHVVLDLCAPAGLEQRTISKRDGGRYREARKLHWGDAV